MWYGIVRVNLPGGDSGLPSASGLPKLYGQRLMERSPRVNEVPRHRAFGRGAIIK